VHHPGRDDLVGITVDPDLDGERPSRQHAGRTWSLLFSSSGPVGELSRLPDPPLSAGVRVVTAPTGGGNPLRGGPGEIVDSVYPSRSQLGSDVGPDSRDSGQAVVSPFGLHWHGSLRTVI
jgi:hypothetical protein